MLLKVTGEKNLSVAFSLYLPRLLFLLPSLLLLPLALLFSWRLSLPALLGSCFIFLYFANDFRFGSEPHPSPSEPGKTVTVLTYNRGQHMNRSLKPFKDRTNPDIIAFQEAPNRAAGYLEAEGYELYEFAEDIGEYTLLSRYPITKKSLIHTVSGDQSVDACARFEVQFEGSKIAIYSIHINSPRDVLHYYKRGAFLYGLIGIPGTALGEKRHKNQQFWNDRIDEASELISHIANDPLPTLVVGDLNAPAGGHIHQLFLREFKDSHRTSGSGFGFTFPGTSRNPLSLGGPWMRIDYLFANSSWDCLWNITESSRLSQHRAVTAQFRLKSP
ncbi:MAG: endonuclease/exonuclease/phosphatase family protein [Verrucomicrobiales bacterium]|nr:endonuclease/exonuclease/phosphatase family protein [Verrucomicrobiales bacterium]